MNYRHAYHAGNFADVMKHVLLIALIDALAKKDKPFMVLDTHAGAGLYDLSGREAQKSREADAGIFQLLSEKNISDDTIKKYIDCVHAFNPDHKSRIKFYPGSPLIAAASVRAQDRVVLCELHRDAHAELKQSLAHNKQVAVHHTDGYLGLKAFLPPAEKRGLILIDPPFEASDEFSRLVRDLKPALARFPTGVYALWYPIKDIHLVQRFHWQLREHLNLPMLALELSIYPETNERLSGSGLVIINPPFEFEKKAKSLLKTLWKVLNNQEAGGVIAQFLK